MKIYKGIEELIKNKDKLPRAGWIFVDKSFNRTSPSDIASKEFMVAEDEDEEFDLEDTKATWLEAPMFLMIWKLRAEANPQVGTAEVTKAAIHYLEKDTFM